MKNNFNSFCVAILGIMSLGIFYFWDTYANGSLKNIIYAFYMFSAIFFVFDIIYNKFSVKYYCYFLILYCLIFINYIVFYRNNILENPKLILAAILYPFFFTYLTYLNYGEKKQIFILFYRLFAYILLPSIMIWLLIFIGFNMPYDIVLPEHSGKLASGMIYRCYYKMSVLLMHNTSVLTLSRLCGVFDEPGVVGTVAGLLLAANGLSFHRISSFIILVAGCLSFSTAFFIVLAILIFFKILKWHKPYAIIALILLISSYAVFINAPITFAPLARLQRGVTVNNFQLKGNNRMSIEADREFSRLIRENPFILVLGKGDGAIMANPLLFGSWSYKLFIYEHGLIGVFIQSIMLLIAIVVGNKNFNFNRDQRILIFLWVLSLYQRPDALMSLGYFIVLVGGIANLAHGKLCKRN